MPKTNPKSKGSETTSDDEGPSFSACFERFLPDAQNLAAADVQPFRADARLALANARRGIANLGVTAADIHKHMPHAPVAEVLGVADLARAVVFATTRVGSRPTSDGEIARKLREVTGPREQMLKTAEVLADHDVFDPDVVARIREGSGRLDIAVDGIALAGLYTANAKKAAGKHPFTPEKIEKLRVASEWLVEHLTPTGAKKDAPARDNEPADTRDRLWTLLTTRHDWLRRVAHYFHGDAFESLAPRLQSHVATAEPDPADGGNEGSGGAAGGGGTSGGTPPTK